MTFFSAYMHQGHVYRVAQRNFMQHSQRSHRGPALGPLSKLALALPACRSNDTGTKLQYPSCYSPGAKWRVSLIGAFKLMYRVLSQSSGLPAQQPTLCNSLLCLTKHTYSKHSATFNSLQLEGCQMTGLFMNNHIGFLSECVKTMFWVSYCYSLLQLAASIHCTWPAVPSSALPPAASSSCTPLTFPTQLSKQSNLNTSGDRHMAHSAKQESPLQSCLHCILNCSDPRRNFKWQSRKLTQDVQPEPSWASEGYMRT